MLNTAVYRTEAAEMEARGMTLAVEEAGVRQPAAFVPAGGRVAGRITVTGLVVTRGRSVISVGARVACCAAAGIGRAIPFVYASRCGTTI